MKPMLVQVGPKDVGNALACLSSIEQGEFFNAFFGALRRICLEEYLVEKQMLYIYQELNELSRGLLEAWKQEEVDGRDKNATP